MATPQAPQKRKPKLRNTDVKTWALPGIDEVFTQDPLTFFEKNDFLGLVSRALEAAVADGRGINDLLMLFGTDEATLRRAQKGELDWGDVGMASGVIGIISRVFTMAPGLMEDAYLLMLSVPPTRVYEVREALRKIDDDTGFGMMEAFVEQNAETLKDFLPRWKAQFEKMMSMYQSKTEVAPVT